MEQIIILVGNLGNDPEIKEIRDDYHVTNFSLATNRRWKNRDGERQDETTWFRISVFGGQAIPCEKYLSKGRQVMVRGRLKVDPETGGPRVYERSDGTMGASFEVNADSVTFLSGGDSRKEEESSGGDPWD